MRVLIAITKGEVGGAQEHVKILAQGLLAKGHKVALAASDPSPLAESLRAMGGVLFSWNSIVGPVDPRADVQARRELRGVVARWQPDIVHLNSSKAGVLGVGLLSPPHGVTIFTCHHTPFGPRRLWKNRVLARPIEQLLLPRMDGIISDGIRDMPLLQQIAPKVPLTHIANAVPAKGEPVSVESLSPRILWVARMAHPKDPLLACKAFKELHAVRPDAHFTLCGTGPLERDLREWIEKSNLGSSIEYPGFVPDLDIVYASSSIFLLVTKIEGGLTMATLEAMTKGLVPVVTDAGDAEFLEEADCGVFVRDYSATGIAEAMLELLANPDKYSHLRSNALSYSRLERTPDDLVSETIDFYECVMELSGVKGS